MKKESDPKSKEEGIGIEMKNNDRMGRDVGTDSYPIEMEKGRSSPNKKRRLHRFNRTKREKNVEEQ